MDPEIYNGAEYKEAKSSVTKVDQAQNALVKLVFFLAFLFFIAVAGLVYLGMETKEDTSESIAELKEIVEHLEEVAVSTDTNAATNKAILESLVAAETARMEEEKQRGPRLAGAINEVNAALAIGIAAHDKNVADRLDLILKSRGSAPPPRRPITATRVSPHKNLNTSVAPSVPKAAPAPAPAPKPPPTTTTTCPKRGKSNICR